jgi:branched-chain amino acid transport system ATP-binding protein
MAFIETRELRLAFGGVRAIDGLSFAVERGEVFAIIGPNGAGKTSVFNLLSRVYAPDAGRIVFDGSDITRLPPHRVAHLGIARTFQNLRLFERASVLDNLMLGRYRTSRLNFWQQALFTPAARAQRRADRARAEKVIRFLELERHRDTLVQGLPYGVKKVVELGRALALEPTLLLLDEPSSGLNPEERRELAFWIRDIRDVLGITVVLIEHDMELVGAVADRVLALNAGRPLACGSPRAVRADRAVQEAYLGADARATA